MTLVHENLVDIQDIDGRLSKVMSDVQMAYPVFHEKQEIANRNADFVKNKQWTDQELEIHEIQQRKAYVFNMIRRYIDHMIGTQVQTRMDAKLLPREPGDEKEIELLQHILKWSEQNSDIDIVETSVFEDGLIKGFGAVSIRWEVEDLDFGYPYIEKVPMNQLYWDPNSKRKDCADATFMYRTQTTSKKEAKNMFPDQAELIEGQSANSVFANNMLTSREKDVLASFSDDLVDIIEHYEKFDIYEYIISDELTGKITKFINETDANKFFNGLITQYSEDATPITDDSGHQLVRFRTATTKRLFQTVIVGNEVIRAYMTSLNDFPFVIYFPYFDDGEFTAVVDSMIDPQILINRMFSQWDKQVGSQMKQAMTVMKNLLPRDFTLEDLRSEISKTSPLIPVLNHGAINPLPNISVNPEMFNGINFGITTIEQIAGGRNLNGTGESASESGKAAAIRAEQGGLARLPLYDNLRLWKKNVALRVLWWIKGYMSSVQIARIVGQTDVEFVDIDDDYLDTLREIKVDIIVDEAVNSATMRERNMTQLAQVIQTSAGAMPPEVYLPMLIEMTELPMTIKTKFLEQLDLNKQFLESQSKLAEMTKIVKAVENSELRRKLKEVSKQKEEIAEAQEDIESEKEELAKSEEELNAQKSSVPSENDINNYLSTQEQ